MSLRSLAHRSTAALVGGAMLTLSLSPASALTISGPPLGQSIASAQIDKVWWRRWGWWGPGAVLGGLAAGALVGGYYGGYYGPGYYGPAYYGPGYYGPGYYGQCWRRVAGPYGWRWARVC